ncbi:MAG TPA: tripartite tricarboxylate transporter substrate binding protein [Xanthobacteraceae bacterium]|nr:tripartite tricarboxylate transporter substrate binding protein [Xanthobacteraceae bacterium]
MMKRRRLLQLGAGAAGALALPAASRLARAQTYPVRPVRLIVGFGAGGAPDILARLVAQWLSDHLGQPFVVENRTGASSEIATETVVKAAPDGHTLLLASLANAVNATLYPKLTYNFIRDIAPVAGISRDPNVMVVTSAYPTKTVPEFIAYAKVNPGKINMGSPGVGTSPHMAGELFKVMTAVDMTHVAYRGSPQVLTDLLGGQLQVYFAPIAASLGYIKDGRLRALGVTTAARVNALPDVPTLAEFVPGYESNAFYGIGAPKGTPAEIVDKLNKAINAGLADSTMKARLAELGSSPSAGSPADFGKLVADETQKWAKVIKSGNIKPE